MTIGELLSRLRRLDVEVLADGDKLRLSAPPGILTDELRGQLVARKLEVLAFLRVAQSLSAPSATVVPVQSEGQGPPFFAVPGHNGDVFCYVHLARHLGNERPFYALQPPGLDGLRRPIGTIEELADHFVKELRARLPGGPYLLGGYCVGGSVAFETARQLRTLGEPVPLLALMGSPSPGAFRPGQQVRAVASRLAGRCAIHLRELRALPPADQLRYLFDKLRERGQRRRGRNQLPDLHRHHRLRVEQATLAAMGTYRPRPFDGRISLFLPNQAWCRTDDRPLDWRALAGGSFETVCGPDDGNADTMLREPHVRWLAGELRARLDRATA